MEPLLLITNADAGTTEDGQKASPFLRELEIVPTREKGEAFRIRKSRDGC